MRLNECAVQLPSEEEKILRFQHHERKERVPFVIYADFECLLEELEQPSMEHRRRRTYAYQRHKAYSVGYYVQCSDDPTLCRYRAHRDDTDCVQWIVRELWEFANVAYSWLCVKKPMTPLTQQQWRSFHEATTCHVCGGPFDRGEDDRKVRDHCHSTDEYRGAAHRSCNLRYQRSCTIPVVFHNLSGYDAHFVIKELADAFNGKISLLPLTKERYISFTKDVEDLRGDGKNWRKMLKFRFVDSFKFLATSLQNLATDLGKQRTTILRREFEHLPDEQFDLITRKGIFPYD